MQVSEIRMLRKEARAKYREYKGKSHFSTPIDNEIRRAYQLLAQGKLVIKALESIQTAGLNEKNWPKLAIARADAKRCHLSMGSDGSAYMRSHEWRNTANERFRWEADAFPKIKRSSWELKNAEAEAIVPLIPLHLRPTASLENYHILWEAEWTGVVPRDPLLLRRIGKGDMWLVLAQWDLTEIERAALQARVSVN